MRAFRLPMLLATPLLLLAGCSYQQLYRTHSAASVPRLLDVNPYSFREEEARKELVGMQGGASYGLAWADSGKVHGAKVVHGGVSVRGARIAAGWTPYWADAQVSHEGTGGFGSFLWFAAHFGGGPRWRFSFKANYAYMLKTNEKDNCDAGSIVFSRTSCPPTKWAHSEVNVKDVGLLLTAETRLSERDSLVLAPGAYWTRVDAGNKLDTDPSGDYARRTHFWSPALQVGYARDLSGTAPLKLAVWLGAQWVKTFEPGQEKRQLMPTGTVALHY